MKKHPLRRAAGRATTALLAGCMLAPVFAADDARTTDPRYLGGIWNSERFFVLIGSTPKLPATQALTDSYAKATKDGSILGTAWTTCRPGSPSAMIMVQGSLAVLQSDEEITISLEQPRMTRRIHMNAEHPADIEPSYLGHSVGRWSSTPSASMATSSSTPWPSPPARSCVRWNA
jgi:hypothetical protein